MTWLADLVGAIGAGLVEGRVVADRASCEVAGLYRDEVLLNGARVPRMVLSEVTVEVRCATAGVDGRRVDLLVTAEELARTRPENIGTLVLKYAEEDLEPPARTE
ncbi:hypothetical protein ACFWNN_40015 [Lentzea sp. NPDC058450]|uniref:hypothetical protein n=1 Tax=Lentzea sp. NPDC058450 TaxID=3346505 RepID=UPI0036505C45